MRAGRFEPVQRLDRSARAGPRAFDDEQHFARRRGEQRRIGKPERRRPIDHDELEPLARLGDDLADAARRQEVCGARRNRSARQQPQVLMLGLDDMIVDSIVGRQELAQPDVLARGLERWLAKVAVDQQDRSCRGARNSAQARAPTTICLRRHRVLVSNTTFGMPDSVLNRSAATIAE